mmetsp:Transcript_10347/g.63250  ORF Transcript_10347/g.63250 Transcript_10347/m.63250 type:complete len:215 (-) Transcript_10347:271-915(-)
MNPPSCAVISSGGKSASQKADQNSQDSSAMLASLSWVDPNMYSITSFMKGMSFSGCTSISCTSPLHTCFLTWLSASLAKAKSPWRYRSRFSCSAEGMYPTTRLTHARASLRNSASCEPNLAMSLGTIRLRGQSPSPWRGFSSSIGASSQSLYTVSRAPATVSLSSASSISQRWLSNSGQSATPLRATMAVVAVAAVCRIVRSFTCRQGSSMHLT